MEALSTMDILYTDKTGTLTYGDFKVSDYAMEEDVLKEVVYMEQQSSHPIAVAIVSAFKDIDLSEVNRNEPITEVAGSGVQKGAIKVGKPGSFKDYNDPYDYRSKLAQADTTVFVANDTDIIGFFSLADQIRPQAHHAVNGFYRDGITVSLLTGDNEAVAKKVARELNISQYESQLLPEDKIKYVIRSQENDDVVGMIGDGINDAPALANADIGIAMGSGSSVAMESSDVVIVQNDLEKLYESYQLSHTLNSIIKQNLFFSVAVIIILITLNMFGVLGLPLAVLFHEGSTILVILNGLRLLNYKSKKE